VSAGPVLIAVLVRNVVDPGFITAGGAGVYRGGRESGQCCGSSSGSCGSNGVRGSGPSSGSCGSNGSGVMGLGRRSCGSKGGGGDSCNFFGCGGRAIGGGVHRRGWVLCGGRRWLGGQVAVGGVAVGRVVTGL